MTNLLNLTHTTSLLLLRLEPLHRARLGHGLDGEIPSGCPSRVTGIIARAQARGEVAPGDPRLYAFSLVGPMVMAMLFREVFGGVDANPPDLDALADQHARSALRGLSRRQSGAPMDGGQNEAE